MGTDKGHEAETNNAEVNPEDNGVANGARDEQGATTSLAENAATESKQEPAGETSAAAQD